MQVILPILEFIQSILTKPAWIMGLFAFVGLVALKRPAHKVMTGTLKPILGYIMLSAGAAGAQPRDFKPVSAARCERRLGLAGGAAAPLVRRSRNGKRDTGRGGTGHRRAGARGAGRA